MNLDGDSGVGLLPAWGFVAGVPSLPWTRLAVGSRNRVACDGEGQAPVGAQEGAVGVSQAEVSEVP